MTAMLHLGITWVADRFLNGIPEGVAVAVLAWLCLRIFVRHSSGKRFVIWLSALIATVLLPLARSWWVAGNSAAWAPVSVPESWVRNFGLAWIALSSLALIRVAWGIWNVRKLRREASPLDTALLDPALQRTLDCPVRGRKVKLALSSRLSVPAVIGFFRPMILLPAWSFDDLSSEQLNSVLMHELAHLRRWDDWTNLAQKLARALFFFHPAIWWIDYQLSLEREMACDEFVLANMKNPRAYAECLVSLAEKSVLRRTLGLAQALLGHMGQTSQRVAQILDPNRSIVSRRWKPAFALMAIVSAAGIFWLMRSPDLVAFRDDSAGPMGVAALAQPASGAFREASTNGASLTPKVTFTSFNERATAVQRVKAAKKHAVKKPTAPVLKAATQETQPFVPQVIQASSQPSSAQAPIETVYVVTEMKSFGANQPASWTLCVWRITVVSSRSSRSQDLVNRQPEVVLPPSKT